LLTEVVNATTLSRAISRVSTEVHFQAPQPQEFVDVFVVSEENFLIDLRTSFFFVIVFMEQIAYRKLKIT
jgi:hypothetical protein